MGDDCGGSGYEVVVEFIHGGGDGSDVGCIF